MRSCQRQHFRNLMLIVYHLINIGLGQLNVIVGKQLSYNKASQYYRARYFNSVLKQIGKIKILEIKDFKFMFVYIETAYK